MLDSKHYKRLTATHRVITIHWSSMGEAGTRKRKWGGKANSWKMNKLHDALYIVPNSVKIEEIHDALMEVLAPSDRAAFMYPYGSTKSEASAMHVRLYGKAAQ